MGNEIQQYELVKNNGVFDSIAAFENGQRMSKLLSESDLVPQQYHKNIANCTIGLEIAQRIGASPLAVFQNLYIVHGKPAWSSQFLISCVNASGRFTPIRYQMSGDGDARQCVAWAQDKSGEKLESPPVSIGMAKAEGWYSKNGSKWKTMPELMLRYRAATLFARLYAPELTMGIHTDDEVIDVSPVVTDHPVKVKVSPFEQPKKQLDATHDADAASAGLVGEPKSETKDWSKATYQGMIDYIGNALHAAGLSTADADKWASDAKSKTLPEMPLSQLRFICNEINSWIVRVKASKEAK